ncbi:hypothetical protein QVD17_36161 [Tagetes erecta]|uniref:CCHC-type domain-containing protein n=1 Tax=Tagetes erecta TaxID=13708 RepID=A0AAD8JVT2_TARER|nr:hypothetical protein QVD17_36161 [Tagetes erecta]
MADKGKGIADDSSSSKRKRNGDDKSGNRKRKNRNVLQFFEDSAFEIDESGSSDEDDFINDDINIYFEEDVGPDPEVKAEPKTPNTPFFPKEEDMDEEEMDKLMEERYKPGAGFVKYAEDRSKTARMDERNTFIPLEKDPPIWKVKCTVGRERHSAFCLMQKYVDLKALGTKLQIISAFAVEHVKGFIFIEAEKQRDINEACKGLCYIYPSRVAVVPVSEVSHLFSVRSKYSGVSADTWARVKNGKYKGDLAQVVFVDEAKRKVTVKLVPRIDLQAVSEKFGGGVTAKKNTIPAPRLVTSSELEAYRPLIQYRRDRDTNDMYEVFDGMTLKDGYLYKKVPLDSLSFWDVRPSEAELIKFTPANKEESNDAEWLTGLFGERKKKGPSVSKINTGGKGESSSSSAMENGFEVPDLVLHGRKAFGIVIGREKDDRIKVLEEGSDRPMVVAVESRLLKKADFDKKFTAFDQHKKIISINDTVRILEGPLEDKRGIVKQIYKGVIFLHDENETENCGYFCAKAQICEKMNFSADIFKGGKGGKSDASGFDDMPTSPKSPLSPNKAWEGRDNTRNFDQEDKEGLSVGQSCRIRVGPLKGYMCRVMAIRYSDITVKLDSQHKILTVKSEHLAEVRAKSSAVSLGDGQDSAKPFELLGESGSSQGWMDAGATSEPGGGGWNTGGQSTERSAWAPFSANSSGDNDANKDAGGSGWDTKTTQDTIPWGASSSENKTGGWGASSSGVKNDSSDDAGWGNAGGSNGGENKPAWGSAPAPATEDKNTPAWGKQDTAGGENKPAWGSAPAPASEGGGWGSLKKDESTSAWGNQDTAGGENKSAWGSAPAPASESGSAGGWGSAKQDENKTGWGKQDTTTTGGSSWGNKQASDGGNKDEDGVGAWGKKVDTGGESGKWGSADKAEGGGSGWGNSKDTGGSSWSKPADGGGSSWSKPADGGGSSWSKPADGGGSSWSKPADGGGSSWSKPADGGGSSWGSQDGGGGSSWSKQEGRSGGGGGGNACFKCGETGHMSRECPQGGGGGGGSRNCYKCGESGHMSRECPKGGGGGGGNACFKCGETGHMSRECPQGGSGGGNRNCYKCGESGHMSRECPKGGGGGGGGNSCFKCGEAGHMSRECPQGGGGGGNKSCYKCGESGHMSRECPQGGSGGGGGGGRSCYKCGESGHMSRECPQGGGGGGGGGGRSCYKCGESGHMSRECPQGGGGGGGGGGRSCYKCGESGHMSRECPQGGGGGGGRNCFKCGESGHMSRECPQGGGGGSSGGGGGWSSSGGWGSNKGSDAGGGSAGGGGWSSSGGLGANKGSDAGGGSSGGGGGGGWSSSGGWGSSNKGPDAADGGKKDDAQGNQWGSSSGGQTAGWGSDGGGNAQGSGWGGGDQTAGKKQVNRRHKEAYASF